MAYPSSTSSWTMTPKEGIEGLRFHKDVQIPSLGEKQCLVKIFAASLNYRDIAMPLGRYPMPFAHKVVPCSDASGIVVAIGPGVSLHEIGDEVCTLFNQEHQKGFLTPAIRKTSLGSHRDGVLREYAIFDEHGLVHKPATLSLRDASTLPCAALTAWNALTGVADRAVQKDQYVLTQGTGGVSIFAIQFALAKGAIVIATTSSEAKAKWLRTIGVQHVINYKTDPTWGETARRLTTNEEGVHHIIEVGGESTIAQSLKAVRCEGVISVIGFLGGKSDEQQRTSFAECLLTLAVVRGVNVGSAEQFAVMNEIIDEHNIKPILDPRSWAYDQVKEAYQYMIDQKHEGKIVIDVAGNR